ncbi:amidase [Saccharopolyspora tripterygii]
MGDERLWACTAVDLAQLVADRQVSAREVVEAHLDRVDAVNPQVNAVTEVFADTAAAEAAELDARLARGEPGGPLAGVPFSVKDNTDVAGRATTHGLPRFREFVRPVDAPPVERLRRAGAIPIGHTNLPTMTLRGMHTVSELHGHTINPWDRTKTPGGTSGGDAVAVATGMAPVGLGNDSGGSLRNPATFGGVCGLKPSTGRYPSDHRFGPDDPSLSSQVIPVDGPMARTVGELRLAHRALVGTEARDPRAVPVPVEGPDLERPIKVGFVVDPTGSGVDAEVRAGLVGAADALTDAGYEVVEVELPRLQEALDTYGKMIMTEFAPGWPMIRDLVGPEAARYMELSMQEGSPVELPEYLGLTGTRLGIQRAWAQLMDEYPLVLGPVSTRLSFEPEEESRGLEEFRAYGRSMALCTASSFVGVPAVAVPTGTASGLPRGAQVIGQMFREDLCLDAAEVIQGAFQPSTPIDPR